MRCGPSWYDNPKNDIRHKPGEPTRKKQDEENDTNNSGVYFEIFANPSTYTGNFDVSC